MSPESPTPSSASRPRPTKETGQPKKRWFSKYWKLFVVVLLPLTAAATYVSYAMWNDLHRFSLERRQAIAYLASTIVKERLDRIADVGTALANQPLFRTLVAEKKWTEAIDLVGAPSRQFPFIDRVFLTDLGGTLKANTPAIPDVIGQNFSRRDWYAGVTKTWEPYVSEVYERAAEPKFNLVTVVIPVKADDGTPVGIFGLHIPLATFVAWTNQVDIGPNGFVYVVDQKGNVVVHRDYPPDGPIANLATIPNVARVLNGMTGVEVSFSQDNQEYRVVAYAPVPHYGWGAVVVQPAASALAERNREVARLAIALLVAIIAVGIFSRRIIRAQAMIRSQHEREETFLESIGDGVFAIDTDWRITLWNYAASKLTGYAPGEALGEPLRDVVRLVREDTKEEYYDFIDRAMTLRRTTTMDATLLLITKNGKEFPVGDSAAPVFDERGVCTGVIVVFHDVSRERELDRAKEEFISIASHQLRTPLTAISGYASLLESGDLGPPSPEQTEAVKALITSSRRMTDLANALLNVSRLDLETFAIEPQPTDLAEIVAFALNELSFAIKEKQLVVKTQIDGQLPLMNVDPRLMGMVLQNLLANAVKYTPREGTISVRLLKQEPDVLIRVSDTGIGIPYAERSKIFSKLFRASNARALEPNGTGLGLYIVKSILDATGGKIWFVSEEKKGTTFLLALPLTGMKKRTGTEGMAYRP